MGEGFANPVVGGADKLIRRAIQSPNYVTGVSGWTINKDGSAEFASAILRGVLELGPASPAPRISASGAADVPATLQNFSADFTWAAAHILWFNGTDYYFWAIGTYVGGGGPFSVEAKGTYDTVNSVLFEEIIQKTSISFVLHGSGVYNSVPTTWIYRNGSLTIDTLAGCDFNFDGFSAPRTLLGAFFTQAGTVASSVGAESAIAAWDANSNASVTLVNGRVYEFRVTLGIFNSTAGTSEQTSTVRLRQAVNSTVATLLGTIILDSPGLSSQVVTRQFSFRVFNTSGVNKGVTPGLTIQRSSGAGTHGLYGDPTITTSIEVADIGRAIDLGAMSFYNASVV